MGEFDVVTVEDIRLMQGLAQRVTAVRPDLVNSDATFGELAWIWGKGHASDGGTWPCRLWVSGGELVATNRLADLYEGAAVEVKR